MGDSASNLEKARQYLKAIEEGDAAFVANLFAPDALMEQLPNRIYPQGLKASVSQMAAAFEKGRKLLSRQCYEITNAVATENIVVLEVVWTGKLAISFGKLEAGSEMRAYSAMFIKFENGKIMSQRNYDCFEPF